MHSKQSDRIIISLDIGSESIKVIKGLKQGGEIRVLDFACQKYPIQEATPNLVSHYIYELLTSVVDVKRIKKARVHATISGRKLCVRVVKLPVMPVDEVQQAIKSQIRKFVSPDLEQVVFSFSILREIQEKDVNKLEVVFVAIQKHSFDEYLQLFKLVGVKPEVITSACFCGWNLVRQTDLDKDTSSLMLINIEAQDTDLTVYRDGRFVFTRNISIGVKDFADIKVDLFCKEIELTANHYYQITHGKRIDKCIVLGEGSQIKGLLKALNQNLEISLQALCISDIKQTLTINKREEFAKNLPLYTQSLGALLISSNDINLLAQIKPQLRKGISALKFLALPKMTVLAIIMFVSLALIIFILLKGTNLFYQYQIKSYKMKQDKLQNRALQLMRIKQKMDILDFEKQLYARLIKRYPTYLAFIAQICQAISNGGIVLNELEFHSDQIETGSSERLSMTRFSMKGKILEKDTPESEITRFVLALEQSDYFENISVVMERAKKKGLNFVIDGMARLKD
jgi:Tfp pilus assembly PilM family ATPase